MEIFVITDKKDVLTVRSLEYTAKVIEDYETNRVVIKDTNGWPISIIYGSTYPNKSDFKIAVLSEIIRLIKPIN